jgi:DeoR/GlpR family transcriptional regulator of sugar metabolism
VNDLLTAGSRHLVPAERRRQILELLRERGSIAVAEVEEGFGVSPMTARRDLALLAEEGRARRTHGGAVLAELSGHENAFESRLAQDVDDKQRLAQAVVATLTPHETIFIDSSTTAHYVVREILRARVALTIVTNSIAAITTITNADGSDVELIGLGGGLRPVSKSFVGSDTVRAIRDVYVDRLVFSVKGIEREGFLTDPDPLEAEVKRAMVERARTVVLVAAARKFDERGLHVIAHAARVHIAHLADAPIDGVATLEQAGVQVHAV